MNQQEQEERDFTITTAAEWDRDEALDIGFHHPERAWILTGRDVWHRNPYYVGPPQPHPEE